MLSCVIPANFDAQQSAMGGCEFFMVPNVKKTVLHNSNESDVQ
jgi:hypothetical protein